VRSLVTRRDAQWQQVFTAQPERRREIEPNSKQRKRRPAPSHFQSKRDNSLRGFEAWSGAHDRQPDAPQESGGGFSGDGIGCSWGHQSSGTCKK
jgi:hypothetical protein